MAINVNNFIIDRIVKGVAYDAATGEVLFSINQIENPSLSCTSEATDAVDALGTPITSFERSKSAEFSAENSIFDLSLLAAQMGTDKEVAGTANKIIVPKFDSIIVAADNSAQELAHTPVEAPAVIYAVNGDSSLGKKYNKAETAGADVFAYDAETNKITPPTGLAAGTELFVMYEYESENAVSVTNSAVNFPKSFRFVMEILGCEVCNPDRLVYAYLDFPNCKLSSAVDLTFTTEGKHPFSMKANQRYCDRTKKLFSLLIPEEPDEKA